MRFLVTILVVALSGCVTVPTADLASGGSSGPLPTDAFGGFPDPLILDHDHGDIAAHQLATDSMTALAHLTFRGAGQAPGALFGEIDLLGEDHLVVAALAQGFFIVDVKDRADPHVVSFSPDAGYIADVKSSTTGKSVFVGIELAGFTGIHAWNVGVKERPFLAGAFPIQGGCHMLAVHRDLLYCAPADATIRIFRITETPVAIALVPVGIYAPKGAPAAPVLAKDEKGGVFTHDMTVQDDPLTGEPVMFVSFWNDGVRVVDVSDPANPVELGSWMGEAADETYSGNIHTSMAGLVNGRRVIVTLPEYAAIPSVTLLDATDYAALRPIAVWAPKTEFGNDNPALFSTHNFQLVGSRVVLAMYHGGVWVLDAERELTPLGYLLPAATSLVNVPFFGSSSPNVWDVVLCDGHIYASDITTGLHVLAFEDDVGDPALTSFA